MAIVMEVKRLKLIICYRIIRKYLERIIKKRNKVLHKRTFHDEVEVTLEDGKKHIIRGLNVEYKSCGVFLNEENICKKDEDTEVLIMSNIKKWVSFGTKYQDSGRFWQTYMLWSKFKKLNPDIEV